MNKSKFLSLDTKIQQLKKITNGLRIQHICNSLFMQLIRFGRFGEKVELHSPAKQTLYLLGILGSQKPTDEDIDCDDDRLRKINLLLNEIFGKYLHAYLPTTKELSDGLESGWIKTRDVSTFSFLSYFFESTKVATAQLRADSYNVFKKFDDDLKVISGLTIDETIKISDAIGDLLQKNFDEIFKLYKDIEKIREEISNKSDIDHDTMMEEIISKCQPKMAEAYEKMNHVSCFKFDSLVEEFDKPLIDAFKKIFTTTKGDSKSIHYITEENPIESSPILTEDNEIYYLCSINFLFSAIQLNFERLLKAKINPETFRKHRDMLLEKDCAEIFRAFLPKDALIFESVFENNKSSFEHDLLIIYARVAIIIEAKASPRREPLRDPTKAFQRISDDFKKKSGIQSGYDQARRLEKLLERKQITPLYTKKGDLLVEIDGNNIEEIFSICVTKDDFGVLATNLTLLLKKEDEAKYPLVINISDLKYFLNCLQYIGKDWSFFLSYLRERRLVHGKILSADELEFAGAYLKYGTLLFAKGIHDRYTKTVLDINESNIFDDIHFAQEEGKKIEVNITPAPYSEFSKDKFLRQLRTSPKNKEQKKEKRKKSKDARKKTRR